MPSHIQQYEFLHGCVLTALVRNDLPSTVRLIETDASASWSMYRVNDACIHIKPSTAPKTQIKDHSKVWQFTFSENELDKIVTHESHVVLVCAYSDMKTKDRMWRILIKHDELKTLVDLDTIPDQDSLTAKYKPNAKKLIISGNGKEILIAPKALFDWQIPGS